MIGKLFVAFWQDQYSDEKYSDELYRECLSSLQAADLSPRVFREAIVGALCWKDGKGKQYQNERIVTAKPNTIKNIPRMSDEEIGPILTKYLEYRNRPLVMDRGQWLYRYLTDDLKMWDTVVIPVFICHLAKPAQIPIVDQHVVRAQRILQGDTGNISITRLVWKDYVKYYDFYWEVAHNLGYSNFEDFRKLDKALWAFGKIWKATIGGIDAENEPPLPIAPGGTAPPPPPVVPVFGGAPPPLTPGLAPHLDQVFAQRCYYHTTMGQSQQQAIQSACEDYGIIFNDLPAMYSQYAGRGFHEWRMKHWIP